MSKLFPRQNTNPSSTSSLPPMFGRDAGTLVPGTKYPAPSYEPNAPEDFVDAQAILNEMQLEKTLRFHADNP